MPCGNSRALEEEERPLLLLARTQPMKGLESLFTVVSTIFLSIIFFLLMPCGGLGYVDHKGCRP